MLVMIRGMTHRKRPATREIVGSVIQGGDILAGGESKKVKLCCDVLIQMLGCHETIESHVE